MQKQPYKIPKNLCQLCYDTVGRFIMDCYCIICQDCFTKLPHNLPECSLCRKPTQNNKIDAQQHQSMKKISHLFENIDVGLNKMRTNYIFQNQITSRYCQHLQKELSRYQQAVNELLYYNPSLYSYFSSRVRIKKTNTQKYDRNIAPNKSETTIKQKQYHPEIMHSKSTEQRLYNNEKQDFPGVRRVGPQSKNNFSGNAIYKVPNLNINTAMRSSKRSSKPSKMEPDNYDIYHKYRRN